MASWRTLEAFAVGIVVLAMVASGVGGVAGPSPAALDDGTATASVETLPVENMYIDEGRFGTSVLYLRVPDLTLRVSEIRGTPRVNYRVSIPALDVEQSSTKLLSDPQQRRVTVPGVDRAFERESVTEDRYDATVAVRIQSFSVDRTIYSANDTVEVKR